MKRILISLIIIFLYVLSYLFFPNYMGFLIIFTSIFGILSSESLLVLFISYLNFSLGIAFDYFLRVDRNFYFYDKSGISIEYLCFFSGIFFCILLFYDGFGNKLLRKYITINVKFPFVSPYAYWPLFVAIAIVIKFILSNTTSLISSDYDAYELQKYPFLEYVSLIISFLILSSRERCGLLKFLSYLISVVFVLVCLVTSYRMVAIISTLAIVYIFCNGKRVNKLPLTFVWLFSYILLTFISYLRIGITHIDFQNILGYQDGRLDNTFTGVIETALIYSSHLNHLGFGDTILFFIGSIIPAPNSLIPNNMIYIGEINKLYYMPGGGILPGFIIYFKYFLLIPYSIYLFISSRFSTNNTFASMMSLILFMTVTRWWLYGPYVIYKFWGVLCVLTFFNFFLCGVTQIISGEKRI